MRRRVERQWETVFRLRRALQRDAAARCRAYWAAHHERGADAKAVRERLGLSRKGIEAAAKAHIEASGWMRDHLTKAIGLHVADEVWETVDRHLFADASGRRHGPPRIGSWWDFTRIPGRARSHTKTTPVWETYRLVGTLDGHLATYRHPQLPAAVSTAVRGGRPAGGHVDPGPAGPAAGPERPASGVVGRSHRGAGGGVHRPAGWGSGVAGAAAPRRGPVGAPVSFPGRSEPCGTRSTWCGCATAKHPAAGGTTRICWSIRPAISPRPPGLVAPQIPTDRRAGVDANVSNLALASFPDGHPEQLVVEQIKCTPEQQKAAENAARRARARQRAMDRSRRNSNPDQYGPSVRQAAEQPAAPPKG